MVDLIISIGIAYCLVQIIWIFVGIVMLIEGGNNCDWTPILFPYEWRRQSRLNWFGVIMASIGGFILSPIIYLCRIFAWLCHVGRK